MKTLITVLALLSISTSVFGLTINTSYTCTDITGHSIQVATANHTVEVHYPNGATELLKESKQTNGEIAFYGNELYMSITGENGDIITFKNYNTRFNEVSGEDYKLRCISN